MAEILVVDDEAAIADLVEVCLKNEGYTVYKCGSGEVALTCVARQHLDLAILDVMLPDLDGFTLCQKIREEHLFPILMLTALDGEAEQLRGFDLEIDDYVTKPFNPLELIARVKSQLRRYVNLGSLSGSPAQSGVYKSGGLIVDDNEKRVTLDGEQVIVTPIEFGILKLLTENAGRVYSIEQIYEQVWNEPAYSPENTVAVHIRRIREKIEIDPKNPRYLKVVWGIGYKIEKF